MYLSDRQWKSLFRDIGNNRCILLLGPRFWAKQENDHARPLLEMLAEHLSTELEAEGVGFEKRAANNLPYIAQRFLSIPKIRRIDLEDETTSFFSRHSAEIPEACLTLSKIPFHLIVNTSPDDLMFRGLKAAGKAANFFYYNFKKDKGVAAPPITAQTPLVFNLFGSLEDPESLVLTEENQVEFIKNVVKGNPPIPYQIMSQFDNRKTYLFLGFDLENWHYRLLLDSLKLEDVNTTISPQMEDYPLTEITKSFYEDRYHFIFVDKKMGDFVNDLYQGFLETHAADNEPTAAVRPKKIVLLNDENGPDTHCAQKLAMHLANFQHSGLADVWHRGLLLPGHDKSQVTEKIGEADLVLAILSADFFASENIVQAELPALMAAHFEKNTFIAPVLHRDCDVENSPLRRFALLPPEGKAISRWDNEDEALRRVVDEIKRFIYA
jgi:hypothetical protein